MRSKKNLLGGGLALLVCTAVAAHAETAYLTVMDVSAVDAARLDEATREALIREALDRAPTLSSLKHVKSSVLGEGGGLFDGSLRLALESRRVRHVGESGPATRSWHGAPIGTLDAIVLHPADPELRVQLSFEIGDAHLDTHAPAVHSRVLTLPSGGGRTAYLVPAGDGTDTVYLVRLSVTPTEAG